MDGGPVLTTIAEFFKFGILGVGWIFAIYLFIRLEKILINVVQGNTQAMTLLAERIEKEVTRHGNN